MGDDNKLEAASGAEQEEGGFGGFMKKYGAIAIGGIATILAFMLGGPLIGFLVLALLGAGLAAMSGMFGQGPQEMIDKGLEATGLREPKPKKELPIEIELNSANPKEPSVTVDGRKYEVKMTTRTDDKSRAIVTKAEYRLAGTEDAFVDLPLPEGDTKRVVGMVGENGFVLDSKQFETNVANQLKKKIEADGRAAKNEMGIEGFRPVDQAKETFAFQAGKDADRAAYTVRVDKQAGSLTIYDATNKEITSVSGIKPEALVDGGPLNRIVATALKKHAEDKTPEKPEAVKVDASKVTIPAAANAISNITLEPSNEHVIAGKFQLDGNDTDLTMKHNGSGKLEALTIMRNGREIKVPVSGQQVGKFVEQTDGTSKFELDEKVLTPLLEKAIKKDDDDIAQYTSPLVKVSAVGAEDKYLYNSKNGLLQLTVIENGFTITDAKGEPLPEGKGEGSDIKGGKDAALREALHRMKDLGVSPEAAPKRGSEGLALSTPAVPYTPARSLDGPPAREMTA